MHSSLRFNDDNLKISIPAVPPSFFGANGLSVARREPLKFTYKLIVQVKARSGHKVKLEEHILVSALPPTLEAINDASTNTTNNDVVSSEDILTHAVIDDGPCDTVALQTGLEDGGVIEVSATGATNIWEQDDTGASSNDYIYQPQVLMFPGEKQDAPSSPTMIEKTNDVDHTTGYNELISKMEVEYDSRLAVDRWMKEYPSVASSLTP
jgi:hypothetical protein